MTENEQLRKELNELRERVAVLESQRAKPAPAPTGPLASLGAMAEQARRQEEQRRLQAPPFTREHLLCKNVGGRPA